MPGYQTLPSGKLRRREIINGKRISFTGSTQKEIRQMIDDYKKNYKEEIEDKNDPTIQIIISDYVDSKEAVLSPSTIREYIRMKNNCFDSINDIRISELKSKDLQYFISNYSKHHSAKSTKNIWGLLSAALNQVTDKKYRVTLPNYVKPKQYTPIDEDIKRFLDACDNELKTAVMLSAFGTLRRGELCAIKYKDINRKDNTITIHADMVQTKNNDWYYKPYPKTNTSIRTILYPEQVISQIPDGDNEDFIIPISPGALYLRFKRKRDKLGMKDLTIQSLRRYAASFMHAMQIPDKYIMEVGGWSSPKILQEVYENTLSDKSIEFNNKRNGYVVDNFFGHKMDTKADKPSI